ncbi:MAG: hypothetical protein WDZ74_01255 [Candidatus Paceibacterota bacterium]
MNNEERTTQMSEEERSSEERRLENDEPGRPIWITILAVAGILAVIFALGISVFQLATRGSDRVSEITAGLGGLFQRSERIVLRVDKSTVNSEDEVTIFLEHRNKDRGENGIYTVQIDCEEEVTARLNDTLVACNEEIELGKETPESFTVTLQAESERYTDIPVIVRYVGGDEVVETDTLLTVVNTDIASTPTKDEDANEDSDEKTVTDAEDSEKITTPQYITVKRYGGRYSDPNGIADLRVSITNTGIIRNGDFRERDEVSENERAALSFTVSNAGTKETGTWYFSALLPTGETYYFKSDTQQNLLPGDRIEYILAFDDIEGRGDTKLYVYADPVNSLAELSEINNIGEAVFDIR